MNKTTKYMLAIAASAIIITAGCKKDKVPPTAPSVTTATLTNITTTSAIAGGTITSDGGSPITASGIVLSKYHATPTLTDTVMSGTTASGSFTINITNLDFATTYYIRAYVTNAIGTGYGSVVTLNTTNDTTKVRFTYNGVQVIYGVISNTSTGRKWMDRNLGASQAATASNDALSYGDLFQWGRGADGHQLRASTTTSTKSSTDAPGHGNFIETYAAGTDPFDWRNPQNANLWQGVNGINNPCPAGWRVPTQPEWAAEIAGGISEINSAFAKLKLPANGIRSINGLIQVAGIYGFYWSSTTETGGKLSGPFSFNASSSYADAMSDRGSARGIRCIKD